MLEGLEISEIKLSDVMKDNLTQRFDADYFKKCFLQDEKILNDIGFARLKSFASIGGGKRLPLGSTFSDVGVPYIRAEDVKGSFVEWDSSPKISENLHLLLHRYQAKHNDVLLTIVGNSIGDVGIVKFDTKCNLTENCVRVVSKDVLPEYLFCYLKSKFGQNTIERERVGTAQPKLAIERIREFKLPKASKAFQEKTKNILENSLQFKKESKQLYIKAEALLLESLGLENFSPSNKNTNIKSFKDSFQATSRLDAEYYQPKYEEINSHLKNHPNGFLPLGDLAETIRGIFVSEELYQDEGKIAYIRGADISSNKLEKDKLVYVDSFNDYNNKEKCQEGDIAFSLIGSVGTASIINKDLVGSLVSNNLGIIRVKDLSKIQPLVLHLFLTHKRVGGELFAQQEMRTAQPKISDKNIHGFPIPLIDPKTQSQISSLIQESFTLKSKSEKLLEVAKKAVEMAIEDSEEKAIKYLEKTDF